LSSMSGGQKGDHRVRAASEAADADEDQEL
jgi:hypothetical protein